jgi:BlaI family penicillinase repressor
MKLTKSELEIMNVLWNAERPLTRSEILSLSEGKSWKDNSIHILLNGLLRKEAIREDGFARSGKVWGRLYAPSISIDEYYEENVFSQSNAEAVPLLFAALLKRSDLTPELCTQLQKILDKKKRELKQ